MSWIQTYTGKSFDLLKPEPTMVCLRDIAHALGSICRFTGHTAIPYSVARHSLNVAELVPPEYRLEALLHDAHEAYVGDMATPMKWLVPDFRHVENRVWAAVAAHFRIPESLPACVKHADRVMLMTERRDLLAICERRWADEFEKIPPLERHINITSMQLGAVDAHDYQRAVEQELDRRGIVP